MSKLDIPPCPWCGPGTVYILPMFELRCAKCDAMAGVVVYPSGRGELSWARQASLSKALVSAG